MNNKHTPVTRYPQVGDLAWIKTNKETSYEGVAYVQKDNSDHWTVINPKDLSQHEHIFIAVDDEYRLLYDELGKPKGVMQALLQKYNTLVAEAREIEEDDNPNDREVIHSLYREAHGYLQSIRYLEAQS